MLHQQLFAWVQNLEQEQKDKLKNPPDYTQGSTFPKEKGGILSSVRTHRVPKITKQPDNWDPYK